MAEELGEDLKATAWSIIKARSPYRRILCRSRSDLGRCVVDNIDNNIPATVILKSEPFVQIYWGQKLHLNFADTIPFSRADSPPAARPEETEGFPMPNAPESPRPKSWSIPSPVIPEASTSGW